MMMLPLNSGLTGYTNEGPHRLLTRGNHVVSWWHESSLKFLRTSQSPLDWEGALLNNQYNNSHESIFLAAWVARKLRTGFASLGLNVSYSHLGLVLPEWGWSLWLASVTSQSHHSGSSGYIALASNGSQGRTRPGTIWILGYTHTQLIFDIPWQA